MLRTIKDDFFMFKIACLVSLGGILYGYDVGVISGALLFIKNAIPMTDLQIGLIVGAVLGGGLIGTLLAGPLGDKFGRRFLLMIASLVFIIGVLNVLIAHTFFLIFSARIFLGVGVGIVSVAVPLYVAEIVTAKDRGKYMTIFQLLLTLGIMLAYLVDLLFTASQNWRAMFAVVLVPAIILFVGSFLLPESPRWLIANKQEKKARAIMRLLYQSSLDIDDNIKVIKNSLQENHGHWSELFSLQNRMLTMVAIGIAIFNQLTGINSFLQYTPLILKHAGLRSDFVTMLGSLGVGALNFLSTLIAIALIDNIGRRPLLLVGIIGVFLSEVFLAVIPSLVINSDLSAMLSLIGLSTFIIFFAVGPGVVVWLAISELFPTRIRGKGIALCLFFNSLAATLLATFFLPLQNELGMADTYLFFAFFSLIYFLIAFYLLPETKTKSLEEIQFQFQEKTTVLKRGLL